MPAHPVGHIKPNPPITGHHLVSEGRPDFCEHGRLKGDLGSMKGPCCVGWDRFSGHAKCECGLLFLARSAAYGKAQHREHKAEIRAERAK